MKEGTAAERAEVAAEIGEEEGAEDEASYRGYGFGPAVRFLGCVGC